METKPLIYGISTFMLVAALLGAGCTSVFPGGAKATPTPLPTSFPTPGPVVTPPGSSCGFTTCHGLDLACGAQAPQICTMEYQIGDKCRQYAHCDTTGGSCTLATSPKFIQCKACADNCQIQSGPDSLAAMTCEEKC